MEAEEERAPLKSAKPWDSKTFQNPIHNHLEDTWSVSLLEKPTLVLLHVPFFLLAPVFKTCVKHFKINFSFASFSFILKFFMMSRWQTQRSRSLRRWGNSSGFWEQQIRVMPPLSLLLLNVKLGSLRILYLKCWGLHLFWGFIFSE